MDSRCRFQDQALAVRLPLNWGMCTLGCCGDGHRPFTVFCMNHTSAEYLDILHSSVYCLSTVGRKKILRLLSCSINETVSNKLLQFEYIEVTENVSNENYLVLIPGDTSKYCCFFKTSEHIYREIRTCYH